VLTKGARVVVDVNAIQPLDTSRSGSPTNWWAGQAEAGPPLLKALRLRREYAISLDLSDPDLGRLPPLDPSEGWPKQFEASICQVSTQIPKRTKKTTPTSPRHHPPAASSGWSGDRVSTCKAPGLGSLVCTVRITVEGIRWLGRPGSPPEPPPTRYRYTRVVQGRGQNRTGSRTIYTCGGGFCCHATEGVSNQSLDRFPQPPSRASQGSPTIAVGGRPTMA